MMEISQDKIALSQRRQAIFTQIIGTEDLVEKLHALVSENAILNTEIVKQKRVDPRWQNNKPVNKKLSQISKQEAFRILKAQKAGVIVLRLSIDKTIKQYAMDFCNEFMPKEEQEWMWQKKLWPFLTSKALAVLKLSAENEAITQLKNYLKSLLQAPKCKDKIIMGVKYGFYQGIRIVIIDGDGKLLDYSIIHPFVPVLAREEGIKDLTKLIIKYNVSLIALGAYGSAMRETRQLFEIIKQRYPDLSYQVQVVDGVGAESFVDLTLPELGAEYHACLSIARRLQNPVLEFAKIDPGILGEKFLFDSNKESIAKEINAILKNQRNNAQPIIKPHLPKNTAMADALLKWKASSAK